MNDLQTGVLPVFDVETTLFGGQTFRWEKEADDSSVSFFGMVYDLEVQVKLSPDNLYPIWLSAAGNPKTTIESYFDLERDYEAAAQKLFADPKLFAFINSVFRKGHEPRLLRQPWFETLIGFIVSANNHIPRIRKTLHVISRTYGQTKGKRPSFAFPSPEALAEASAIDLCEKCNTGYRDRYIQETSKRIVENAGFWERSQEMSSDEIRTALLDLPGIGPKVAECILLFGFHRWEAFPVDTWIRKAVQEAFPETSGFSDRDIHRFACDRFGDLAGLAQQYLFEAARKRNGR
jgi:N-glycosylase/DNA lyase